MKIELNDVSFGFGSKEKNTQILKAFSFSIRSGDFVSFIGPSGCGKSTILRIVAGLILPDKGVVLLDDVPPEYARKNFKIGTVFQKPNLLPWRSIKENIAFPFELANQTVDFKLISRFLSDFQLDNWGESKPEKLSGGMQQRVALIRALIIKPKVLLLDEPFSQLDEILRFKLLFYVRKFAKEFKITVVMITHDVSEAVIVSDKVHVLGHAPLNGSFVTDINLDSSRSISVIETKAFQEIVTRIRLLFENLSK